LQVNVQNNQVVLPNSVTAAALEEARDAMRRVEQQRARTIELPPPTEAEVVSEVEEAVLSSDSEEG
jgi:S-adenosylmethionine:diacylglycerol 3-amino-3-carboxypropyl transferase